jgi:hypothetical protein
MQGVVFCVVGITLLANVCCHVLHVWESFPGSRAGNDKNSLSRYQLRSHHNMFKVTYERWKTIYCSRWATLGIFLTNEFVSAPSHLSCRRRRTGVRCTQVIIAPSLLCVDTAVVSSVTTGSTGTRHSQTTSSTPSD